MKTLTTFAAIFALVLGLSPIAKADPTGSSIVDVALEANGPGGAFEGQLDVLIAALQAADPSVIETLDGMGQFTVFAPTDDAFGNLGLNDGNVGNAFSQSTLTDILLYHVARGNRDSGEVTTSSRIRTMQGEFLMVWGTTLTDELGRDSEIIVPDVMASNGVIHVINEVVLPFQP